MKLIIFNEQDILETYPCLDLVRDKRTGNIKWVDDDGEVMFASSPDCPRGKSFVIDPPPVMELIPFTGELNPLPTVGVS